MCVQRFDDSQCSAIHITFRALLRSSSIREPRDPLLKVFKFCFSSDTKLKQHRLDAKRRRSTSHFRRFVDEGSRRTHLFNDPSAGSPTETLLRLLLPLNDQV
jgi:hypothetical protein